MTHSKNNSKQRDGDTLFLVEEYEQLYRSRYQKAVFYCNQYINDIDKSREIAQEAFINLWERRSTIDPKKGNPEYYLLTSVRNLALNHIRKKMRDAKRAGIQLSIDDQINEIALSYKAEDSLAAKELRLAIDDTLDLMPLDVKEVYLMSREEEMTYAQIADKLGVSVKVVEYRLGKSLALFRKRLAEFIPSLILFLTNF